MMLFEHKRTLAARILLSVFIPMLVCLSLHIHQTADVGEDECYDCVHHLPHSGHASAAKAALHDCLLCQLSHVPFVIPQVITIIDTWNLLPTLHLNFSQPIKEGVQGGILPRAPPQTDIFWCAISFFK
jgi:hypothetical protein